MVFALNLPGKIGIIGCIVNFLTPIGMAKYFILKVLFLRLSGIKETILVLNILSIAVSETSTSPAFRNPTELFAITTVSLV